MKENENIRGAVPKTESGLKKVKISMVLHASLMPIITDVDNVFEVVSVLDINLTRPSGRPYFSVRGTKPDDLK